MKESTKRLNFLGIQLSHHVPCLNGEVSRLRTGMERVVAHRSSEMFSCSAHSDGKVIDIDHKVGIIRLQYSDTPIETHQYVKPPFSNTESLNRASKNEPFGMFISSQDLETFPAGKYFNVSNTLNACVLNSVPVEDPTAIDDKYALAAAKTLIKDAQEKRIPGLYYVTFKFTGKTKPGIVQTYSFGERFSNVSGSHLRQDLVCNVAVGDTVKAGDILVYNAGFFIPEPNSKQVSWKHGVLGTVVLMDTSANLEDGCYISKSFGEKLMMHPAHERTLKIDKTTVLHDLVSEGSEVETIDHLCVMETGEASILTLTDDPTSIDFLSELNSAAPKAKYSGRVAEIKIFYACPTEELSQSLQDLVKTLLKKDRQVKTTTKDSKVSGVRATRVHQVEPGLQYAGVDFEHGTVLLSFMITEDLKAGCGDKIVLCSQSKSVISDTMEKAPLTESGEPVDIVFSATAIYNRIIMSPFLVGIVNRILKKVEVDITDIYFK